MGYKRYIKRQKSENVDIQDFLKNTRKIISQIDILKFTNLSPEDEHIVKTIVKELENASSTFDDKV
ncbi:MAG: hypothetical protein BWY74_00062 [Firmicutes bacterium ADurb.Bin419]|nr:MAG: hypothetical protein BWY74_00062 [Firmicutes bacterium ADurb.Bin419]